MKYKVFILTKTIINLLKGDKQMKNNKKFWICVLLMVLCCASTFAAGNGALEQVKKVFGTIYWFFSSTYMVVICTIGLVIIGIQMITNRGEPVVMKKLVPWAFAVLIVGSASFICNLFFKPSGKFSVENITDGTYTFDSWNQ